MILKTHYGCHCQELRSLRTSRWPSMRWLITGLCVLWIADYSGSWFLTSSVIAHFPAIWFNSLPNNNSALTEPRLSVTRYNIKASSWEKTRIAKQHDVTWSIPSLVWFYTWLPQELISGWVPMFTKMESLNVKVSKNILKISKRIYRIVTSWNV